MGNPRLPMLAKPWPHSPDRAKDLSDHLVAPQQRHFDLTGRAERTRRTGDDYVYVLETGERSNWKGTHLLLQQISQPRGAKIAKTCEAIDHSAKHANRSQRRRIDHQ